MLNTNRVGILLLMCLVAGCGQTIPPQGEWVDFTSTDGRVSAKLPGTPKVHTQSVDTAMGALTITMNVLETRTSAFTVGHVTYPVDPSQYNVANGLQGAVDGAASNVKGTVIESTDIKLSGFPGKQALIQSGDTYSRIRICIDPAGPTIFQGVCVGNREFIDSSDATFFLDSFKVTAR